MYDTKTYKEFAEEMRKLMTPVMPTVNFNKNGMEVEFKLPEPLVSADWYDFDYKFGPWAYTVKKDDDKVVCKSTMPEVAGMDTFMDMANKVKNFAQPKA